MDTLDAITAIKEITRIAVIAANAAIKVIEERKHMKKKGCMRPLNLRRDRLGLMETWSKQLMALDQEHILKSCKMSMENYKLLQSLLMHRLQKFSLNGKVLESNIRLHLTLYFLVDGCSVRFLARSHDIGISTVRKILYETCDAIWEELYTIYVSLPTVNEWNEIANKYYVATGMPHCLGAINGKHVNVICPNNSGKLYKNYKNTFSISLLAACDSDYCFTCVDVGTAASHSDTGIFERSILGKHILDNTLDIPEACNLPGTEIKYPFYFVGDNIFPLKDNLMRPFPGRNLPTDRATYNKMLTTIQGRLENAFGILSSRFRILRKPIHANPSNVDKIVLATVVLHNFLMLQKQNDYFTKELVDHVSNGVVIKGTWRNEFAGLQSIGSQLSSRNAPTAYEIRNTLKTYLQNS